MDSKGDLVNTFNEELGMMFEMAVPLDYSTISEQAQGMAFYNDKLLLSHSFGILPSRIVFMNSRINVCMSMKILQDHTECLR